MRAAADAEMMVRRRQAEVGKEAVRHVDVIVLSGMDQCRHAPVLPLQHVVERRHIRDVGPGRGDKVNLLTRHQAQSPRLITEGRRDGTEWYRKCRNRWEP